MTYIKDWLNQKFIEWEKAQGRKQSYYAFARYLDVSQSSLAQWMTGSQMPAGDDVTAISARLGPEIYDSLGLPRPSTEMQRFTLAFSNLPPDIRKHMVNAIVEAGQAVRKENLNADSPEARRVVLDVLNKWGFQYDR